MFTLSFLDAPMTGAARGVTDFATLLHPVLGGASAAAAIVLLTALVRLALHPLVRAQVRGEKTRARLAPQLGELARRHRDDPARLRAAQAELYRSEQASPLAGCLPSLLMWPVLAVLYRVFSLHTLGGRTNTLFTDELAGVPLGAHALSAMTGQLPVFATLFALLAVTATAAFRRARRIRLAASASAGGTGTGMGTGTGRGAALLPYLSYGTLLFALFQPLSAVVYLLTTTSWTVVERIILRA